MGKGKICCLCYCASCCCVVVVLAVAIGVVAASFEEPAVDVKNARLSNIAVSASNVTFTVSVGVHVSNPNGWPIEGTVENLNARIFSLDKQVTDPALLMGVASLPSPVTIAAKSETDFDVSTGVVIKSESAELYRRIVQDCSIASPDQDGRITTKLRILLLDTVLQVLDTAVDLSGFEIPLETLVDCPDTSSMQQQPPTVMATTPAAPPTTTPAAPAPITTLPLVR
mmetsp:Transcript_88057/g.285037  ORF Transcript_88057/g.285037 Transcript_88057/m.285037 type:complete len:226 (+) Transcript_88057:110-787(+)